MEIETVDSISRLWQAITVPFRLSLMNKSFVVFITPPAPFGPAKQVRKYGLSAQPTKFPFATAGQTFGTTRLMLPSCHPMEVRQRLRGLLTGDGRSGRAVSSAGAGLNQGTDVTTVPNPGTSFRAFLLQPPHYQTETQITAWKAPTSPPLFVQTASRFVLNVPATMAWALPANAPPPGVYSRPAGSSAPPDVVEFRTNATPSDWRRAWMSPDRRPNRSFPI